MWRNITDTARTLTSALRCPTCSPMSVSSGVAEHESAFPLPLARRARPALQRCVGSNLQPVWLRFRALVIENGTHDLALVTYEGVQLSTVEGARQRGSSAAGELHGVEPVPAQCGLVPLHTFLETNRIVNVGQRQHRNVLVD